MLAAFVLALHDDVRRQVREADGRARLVDVLAAGPAGAKRVFADVVGKVDVDHRFVVDGRRDVDRGKRCVAAAGRVERADADQADDCPSLP